MMLGLTAGAEKTAPDDVPLDEAAILRQTRNVPAAFAPLYERYVDRVYRYCLRRAGSPAEAEDLTSIVFTRALTGAGSYRGGSVAAWLFRIAHNAAVNVARERRPQFSLDEDAAGITEPGESGATALDQLLRAEERTLVAKLVRALPPEQRELLELILVAELSAKETGAVLGKREGAVRAALHRTVVQLRKAYRREEGWERD